MPWYLIPSTSNGIILNLKIGFDAFLMSWKTFGVSFLEKAHIKIVLLTRSLGFGLAQASVLVGNLLSLEQG